MERDSERPKTHEVLPFFSHLNQLLYKLAEKSGMQPVLCARVALTYASSHSHLFLSLSLSLSLFFVWGAACDLSACRCERTFSALCFSVSSLPLFLYLHCCCTILRTEGDEEEKKEDIEGVKGATQLRVL
jgi:hypothetical protein